MTPHSAYVWHPLNCRWHHIHFITTNHSIYVVTSTSGMTSHPLYLCITTSPLISHPLLYDITPTFSVASYTHDTQSLCNHTAVLMTSQTLYMKPHPVCRAKYTLYMWHHSHCLCHHTHCIDKSHPLFVWHHTRHMCGIICTIQDITSSLYDLKPPFLWHHTNYIWHCVHCICVITPTVLMISHQLYLWDHICYNSQYHIHCIQHDSLCICVITPTHSMIPHPLYVWHHTHSMYNIIYHI